CPHRGGFSTAKAKAGSRSRTRQATEWRRTASTRRPSSRSNRARFASRSSCATATPQASSSGGWETKTSRPPASLPRIHRREEERTAEDAEDAREERQTGTRNSRSDLRDGDEVGSEGVLASIRLNSGRRQRDRNRNRNRDGDRDRDRDGDRDRIRDRDGHDIQLRHPPSLLLCVLCVLRGEFFFFSTPCPPR